MLSDAQRGNLTEIFRAIDATGDGLITLDDATVRADQLSSACGLDEASPARRDLHAAYRRMWDELMRFADTDHDGAVTLEEFFHAMDRGMLEDPEFVDSAMLVVTRALFTATDSDGDGMIDVEEYVRMFLPIDPGMDGLARAGFAIIDRDGDGAIGRAELVDAMRTVFSGGDGLPGSEGPDALGARVVR